VRKGLEDLLRRVAALQVRKERLDGRASAREHRFGSEHLPAFLDRSAKGAFSRGGCGVADALAERLELDDMRQHDLAVPAVAFP
jgi:hypothetical protein